jgi:uncharacterized protein
MTSAADLLALQEIDLRRDGRRALIADIESRLGETDELRAARDSANRAVAELEQLRRRQHDIDSQLQDIDAKINPVERKLYDGSVRNPKELTDMQKELNIFKGRRSKLDDTGLELIEALDAASKALEQANTALRKAEANWQLDQEDLLTEKSEAEADYSRLESERSLRAEGMDRTSLGLYENLRLTRQGRAVARVERGTCQGCRITLPTHLVQRLRTGDALVQCPSCERILVSS